VRKVVVTKACVIEDRSTTQSLRRSTEVVRGHMLRVFAIAAFINVTAFLLGPIVGLGVLVLFLYLELAGVISVVSSLVYVVVMPYVGIAQALLFDDLRSRSAEEAGLSPGASPAAPASS